MPLLLPRRLPLPRSSSMGFCGSFHLPAGRSYLLPSSTFQSHPTTTTKIFLRKAPPTTILFSVNPPGIRSPRRTSFTRDVHLAPLADETNTSKRFELLEEKLKEAGVPCDHYVPGKYSSLICPKCQGGRQQERSLSLFIRGDGQVAVWRCNRGECGWTGGIQDGKVHNQSPKEKKRRVITEEGLQLEPPCNEIFQYLSMRGISAETLRRNVVRQRKYKDQTVIAFTYRRNGVLVSCKYRAPPKTFWQEQDTERVFYGLDDIKTAKDIIIVEGEMDKLSMEEAGYRNCVSVPGGAPSKVSEVLPEEEKDTGFQYLWTCKEYLDKASRIILATDADGPGQALAEELARRLGKERCWRVQWPMKSDTEFCKDANEVLMYKGKDALKEVIENAELYPIRGLFNFSNFFREIDDYYHCRNGYERGVSTGWKALNDLYNIVPGELTVITGVPNSGKSEWIDALLCNISETEGWTFALCSMENKVREHARKLLEKHIRKPFFNAGYGGTAERMNVDELKRGKEWLNNTFHLIRYEDDCLPSVDWVLSLAKAAVLRYGVRGLVIDPYNELDHQRPPKQTETEYVSQMLTKIKRFAQHHSCHVWFVAHPRQLQQWTGGPPNLYDISGSAHFINKCDNGVVIHRNRDEKAGPLDRVQVCVRKVRNKVIGNIGEVFLSYDRITGRYVDFEEKSEDN